jgi:predicted CopG family antitoxin
MPTKTIRLDEDVYERLRAVKREDETFSEAVDRLLGGGSLVDLIGLWDGTETGDVRDVLDAVDSDGREDVNAVVERVGSDSG